MFEPENALEVLSEERVEIVHNQAMTILEDVGMDVLHEPTLELLREQGQKTEDDRVHFDREWIAEMVAKAPSAFELHARNPERTVTIGDGRKVLTPVGGPPFASDLDDGRRSGSIRDHDALVKLAHAADVMTCLQSATVEAVDLEVSTRHMDMDYSVIRYSDKPYVTYGASGAKARDGIELAAIVHGGREVIEQKPAVMIVINPNSPLVWDTRMAEALLASAEAGQPVVVTPFLLAGGTAPVSVSGALSIQAAEALSGIAIAQAVRPGTPAIYGSFFTPLDMRSGSPAFGMPEAVLGTVAGAQIARRYHLPYRGGGGLASADAVDAQAASESLMSLWATYLCASDFVLHAAGWLEGGLTASFEKFALDVELIRMFERMRRGVGFTEEELALGAIRELGPGGMFLESEHTMTHFRDWLYMSPIFTTPDFATWESMGAETLDRRANAEWKKLLESYEDPGLDPAIDEALQEYIAKRKAEPVEEEE